MTLPRDRLRARAEILRLVRRNGEFGLTRESLNTILNRAGFFAIAQDLEELLRYLEEKGYLRREFKKDLASEVERWLYHITPQGMDLLDDVIEQDPGINCVR